MDSSEKNKAVLKEKDTKLGELEMERALLQGQTKNLQ